MKASPGTSVSGSFCPFGLRRFPVWRGCSDLQGQSGTEHVLFLLGQFRVADLLWDAQTAHGQVCNLVGLAVDTDDALSHEIFLQKE